MDANLPVPIRTGETGVRVRNSVMGVTEHDESWTLGAGTFGVRANFMEGKLFQELNSRFTWSSGGWIHCWEVWREMIRF